MVLDSRLVLAYMQGILGLQCACLLVWWRVQIRLEYTVRLTIIVGLFAFVQGQGLGVCLDCFFGCAKGVVC
jgi:hypothetical protein